MHPVLVVSFLAILGSASSIPAQQFAELAKKQLPGDRPTFALALGDVDGDGDPDLILGNAGAPGDPQTRLYLNDGRGTFTDATAARMPPDSDETLAVALGDVDGDGDLDLVLGNVLGRRNKLYLNNGTGTFTNATAGRMPPDSDDTYALALGDVDSDGDLDLVLGNVQLFPQGGRQNRLYLNDGSGTFTDATAARMPPDRDRTWAVALGDVDGDGHPDLVLANDQRGGRGAQNRLYLNDGTGKFSDVTLLRMPTDSDVTHAVALGNVDGDADLDLFFGNQGQNRLYLNNGTGTFRDVTATHMPTDSDNTWALSLGNVDGDADPDLVVGNAAPVGIGQQNRLYLNDGQGTFTDATASRMPTVTDNTYALALGDVDDDGDSDLLAGNFRSQNRLYLNLHRHLDAPLPARIGQPYPLDIYTKPGFAQFSHVALPLIAAAPAHIPLPPFGTLGLDPQAMIILPTINVRAPVGKATIPPTMPADPGLVGATIYSQALILANPVDPTRFTNVMADPIR